MARTTWNIVQITVAERPSDRAPAFSTPLGVPALTRALASLARAGLLMVPVPKASCVLCASASSGSRTGTASVRGELMVSEVGNGMPASVMRSAPVGDRDAPARSSARQHRSGRHDKTTMNAHYFSFGVNAPPGPAELVHFYQPATG
jgi:hypothetical protein